MYKILCVVLAGVFFVPQAMAQKRGDKRGFDKLHLLTNADNDRDYKVDSSELRDWMDIAVKLYEAQRGMRMDSIDISFIKDFDEDLDYDLSTGEKRDLKDFMSERFSEANKKLLAEYDENSNRRFDKDELVALRSEIPNFMRYALRDEDKQEQVEEKVRKKIPVEINGRPNERMKDRELPPEEAPKKKKKLDDIYD